MKIKTFYLGFAPKLEICFAKFRLNFGQFRKVAFSDYFGKQSEFLFSEIFQILQNLGEKSQKFENLKLSFLFQVYCR